MNRAWSSFRHNLTWAAAIFVAALFGGQARIHNAFLALIGILRDGGERVSPEDYSQRMGICEACPIYFSPLKSCGTPLRRDLRPCGCYCYMPVKARYARSTCWIDDALGRDAPPRTDGVPMSPDVRINGRTAEMAANFTKPRKKNPGSLPILGKDVPGLDRTALKPVVPVSTKMVFKAAETLGIRKDWITKGKLRAVDELFRYMSMKMTAQMAMVWSIDSLEQAEYTMRFIRGYLDECALKERELTPYDLSCLANAQAALIKAHRDKTDQLMTLREMALDKSEVSKPKNLPPTLALQLNVNNQPTQPTIKQLPASSGSQKPDNGQTPG